MVAEESRMRGEAPMAVEEASYKDGESQHRSYPRHRLANLHQGDLSEPHLKNLREKDIGQHDQKGDAVDPGDIGDLNDRQLVMLAVTEEGPREAGKQIGPGKLQRNPSPRHSPQ